MNTGPTEHLIEEHGDALRRLALSVAGDHARAEDALQSAWLRVWRSGARRTGSVRGWLAAVVRNEARRARTAELRRVRRETIAARDEVVAGPDEELDRVLVLRALLDALDTLPPPMREAVVLRYLDGLPLREVAARQRVAVRASETRIRRGIERLRARLESRFGPRDVWAPVLAPWAFGAPGASVAVAGGAIAMKGKVAVAVLVAGVAWSLWAWGPWRSEVALPAPASAVPDIAIAERTTDRAPAPADALASRTPVAGSLALPSATVRGRLVDERGDPLTGATIRLEGRDARPLADQEAALLEGGPTEGADPEPVTTAADGGFAIRFEPSPSRAYRWNATALEFVRLDAILGPIRIGEERDLGAVVMLRGATVRGVVVDEDGAPQAAVRVSLRQQSLERRIPRPFFAGQRLEAVTDARGAFEVPLPVAPGTLTLEVPAPRLLRPTGAIRVDGPVTEIRAVVARVVRPDVIAGVVVDEDGAPLERVRCGTLAQGTPAPARSAADGAFRILRREDDAGAVARVAFARAGYDGAERELRWGTLDVQVTLRRRSSLRVHVTDHGGAPVEEFGVRLVVRPEGASLPPPRLREFDVHAGGLLELGVVPGSTDWLRVEPAAGTGLCASAFLTIEESAAASLDVAVRLEPPRERVLRVVGARGSPVAGATIELLEELPDRPATLDCEALDPHRLAETDRSWAIAVQRGATDANGEFSLRGPGDRDLALRFLGPGGLPCVERPVRLDDSAPLVLTVGLAARITGSLGPQKLLADLREVARLPRTGPLGTGDRQKLPAVQLRRREAATERSEWFPPRAAGGAVTIGDDGEFTIDGVPPGDWELMLETSWDQGDTSGRKGELLDVVTGLRGGETRRLAFDRQGRRPARLRAHVTVDGESAGIYMIEFREVDTPSGRPRYEHARVDDAGHADGWVPPGVWQGVVSARVSRTEPFRVRAGATFTASAGQVIEVELRAETGELPVRVLAADGTPAVGLSIRSAEDGLDVVARATDRDGRTTVHAGVGAIRIRGRAAGAKADAPWIPLGEVAVPRTAGAELELRLPAGLPGR